MATFPYEFLFRLNRDGSLRGGHFKEVRVTPAEPGFPEKEEEGDAQPLNVAATKHGVDLAPILGNILPNLLVDLQSKTTELESTIKDKAAAEATAVALQANLDDAEARAEARAEGLEKERDQAIATIEEIHARENEALLKARDAEAALAAEQEAHAETKTALEAAVPSV